MWMWGSNFYYSHGLGTGKPRKSHKIDPRRSPPEENSELVWTNTY